MKCKHCGGKEFTKDDQQVNVCQNCSQPSDSPSLKRSTSKGAIKSSISKVFTKDGKSPNAQTLNLKKSISPSPSGGISEPLYFKHKAHLGFSNTGDFESWELPPEMAMVVQTLNSILQQMGETSLTTAEFQSILSKSPPKDVSNSPPPNDSEEQPFVRKRSNTQSGKLETFFDSKKRLSGKSSSPNISHDTSRPQFVVSNPNTPRNEEDQILSIPNLTLSSLNGGSDNSTSTESNSTPTKRLNNSNTSNTTSNTLYTYEQVQQLLNKQRDQFSEESTKKIVQLKTAYVKKIQSLEQSLQLVETENSQIKEEQSSVTTKVQELGLKIKELETSNNEILNQREKLTQENELLKHENIQLVESREREKEEWEKQKQEITKVFEEEVERQRAKEETERNLRIKLEEKKRLLEHELFLANDRFEKSAQYSNLQEIQKLLKDHFELMKNRTQEDLEAARNEFLKETLEWKKEEINKKNFEIEKIRIELRNYQKQKNAEISDLEKKYDTQIKEKEITYQSEISSLKSRCQSLLSVIEEKEAELNSQKEIYSQLDKLYQQTKVQLKSEPLESEITSPRGLLSSSPNNDTILDEVQPKIKLPTQIDTLPLTRPRNSDAYALPKPRNIEALISPRVEETISPRLRSKDSLNQIAAAIVEQRRISKRCEKVVV